MNRKRGQSIGERLVQWADQSGVDAARARDDQQHAGP